jgi:galactokinase
MTGGGFGGSVIALAPADLAPPITAAVEQAMHDGGFGAPTITATRAAAGAGEVTD